MAAAAAAEPRLVLTQIVLENFKSYYGRREIGPFHKRFSSIVGPNGSGKSNVIDAMLFVFGRRSQKLRSKKVGELVHNSENHRSCKQAKVTVHFKEILDNEASEDEYATVAGSEFSISRVANKRSASQYLMDGSQCTKAAIIAKLLSKKIDLNNNRFLILQGEVESISLMKPKGLTPSEEGLLEYLEEIIGSNQYVAPINENEQQCDVLGSQCQEKLNRVKIVERDRDKLSDAKLEAEAYIKQELQKWKLQGLQQQHHCWRLARKGESLRKHIAASEEEFAGNEGKSDALKVEIQKIDDDYQTVKKDIQDLTDVLAAKSREFQELNAKDTAFNEDYKHLKKEIKKIDKFLKTNKAKMQEIEETIENNETNIPAMEQNNVKLLKKFEVESKKYEEAINEFASKTEPIRAKMEEKQQALIPFKETENKIIGELDSVIAEIEAMDKEAQDANQRQQRLNDKIEEMQASIVIKTKQLSDCEEDFKKSTGDCEHIERKQRDLSEAEGKLREDLGKAQDSLNEKRRSFQNSGGHEGHILKNLLSAQERGHVSGVIGRLGDMGTIEEKYDVAVSTAGSGALNYIVVEKNRHAVQCVEYAKKNRLGRTTYIILEKQRHFENVMDQGRDDTPEHAPRLFDLIKPSKAEYACCFYFAFREMLVASNLDDANRLAFGGARRYPVITMDGKQIALSGTMSGGGNSARRGLMSSVQRMSSDDIQRLRAEMTQLEAKSGELNGRLHANQEEQGRAHRELGDCRRRAEGKKKEIKRQRHELNNLQKRLPNLIQSARKAAEERGEDGEDGEDDGREDGEGARRELEQRQRSVQTQLQHAKEACVSLEEEIEALKDELFDQGGDSVKKLKKRIDKFEKTLKENETNVTKMKVEITNGNKKLVAMKQKAEEKAKEQASNKEKIEKVKDAKKDIEAEAIKVKSAEQEAEDEKNEKMEKYQKMKKEVDRMESKLTALQKRNIQLKTQIKTFKAECRAIRDNVTKSQSKTESLQRRFNENKRTFLGIDDSVKEKEEMQDKEEANQEQKKEGSAIELDGDSKEQNENGGENNDNENDDNEDEDDDIKMEPDGEADDNAKKQKPKENEEESDDNENDEDNPDNASKAKKDDNRANDIDMDVYIDESYLKFDIFNVCDESCELFDDIDMSKIDSEISEIDKELESSKVNMNAIETYRQKDDEYVNRLQDLQLCKQKREDTRSKYEELKKKRFDEFMSAFQIITNKLKEMYRLLTCGGDAELELVDSIDPFSEGVQFSVRPPKKSWKNISNLSGGEKTLSSMALVFALHHFRPTPLYVMDEIDAALDFKNVSIVANYIKQRTKNAQFIIISLRNNMFELGNRLVGIYKTDNASKSITIDPNNFRLPNDTSKSNNSANNGSASNNAGGNGSTASHPRRGNSMLSPANRQSMSRVSQASQARPQQHRPPRASRLSPQRAGRATAPAAAAPPRQPNNEERSESREDKEARLLSQKRKVLKRNSARHSASNNDTVVSSIQQRMSDGDEDDDIM